MPVILEFQMPGDQDWPPDEWDKFGIGEDWDRFYGDLEVGNSAEIEDTENVIITVPHANVWNVLAILVAARQGDYGPNIQLYWTLALPIGLTVEES